MKAIVQDTYGSADVLQLRDVDVPVVGDGDVLGPWCDRAEGMAAAADGNRDDAVAALTRAFQAFDHFGVAFEAARTREEAA